MPDHIIALLIGCALDMAIGDPEWFPHPVRFIGKYISFCEGKLRARGGNLRRGAVLLTASTVIITMLITAAVLYLMSLMGRWPLIAGMAVISWLGLSARCLAHDCGRKQHRWRDIAAYICGAGRACADDGLQGGLDAGLHGGIYG